MNHFNINRVPNHLTVKWLNLPLSIGNKPNGVALYRLSNLFRIVFYFSETHNGHQTTITGAKPVQKTNCALDSHVVNKRRDSSGITSDFSIIMDSLLNDRPSCVRSIAQLFPCRFERRQVPLPNAIHLFFIYSYPRHCFLLFIVVRSRPYNTASTALSLLRIHCIQLFFHRYNCFFFLVHTLVYL